MEEINTKVQQALDSALDQVTGLKLLKSEAYAINPDTLKDPTIGPEMVAQPARSKGLGIRKVDDFVGHAAFVGGIEIVVRRLIDHIAEDGSKVPGLYPLLEDMFGEGSQDYGNAENRFVKFIDGSSTLGEHFLQSIRVLKAQCPGAEDGPLSMPEHEICPVNSNNPKLQAEITAQIEAHRAKDLKKRHEDPDPEDRRRISYQNRLPSTFTIATTPPTKATMVPKYLYTGVIALLMGAIDPTILAARNARIGNTKLRVDLHGDALGAAVLPGDRWRRAHDIFKMQIYQDMKFLGLIAQMEVYGVVKRFFDVEGKDKYDSLNNREKKLQTIVPDFITSNHPEGSPISANGDQMWELKRIHSLTSFNCQGAPKGLNEYYCQRQSATFQRAADQRAKKVPNEYGAKAKNADKNFGAPGSSAVQEAFKAMPQVRGIALGAFGEFSDSINLLIDGLAHEGALKKSDKFGHSKYKAAYGVIHWWLKRRWARLAVIMAIEVRYDALRYTGGSAQQQAAAAHEKAQVQDEWRDQSAYFQREAEASAPFFPIF